MYHGICLNWHCEAPEGPRQSRKGGYDIADGFPVIHAGTARLPRRLRLLAMTNLEALTAHIASLHGGHCPMDKSDIPGFARSDIFLFGT